MSSLLAALLPVLEVRSVAIESCETHRRQRARSQAAAGPAKLCSGAEAIESCETHRRQRARSQVAAVPAKLGSGAEASVVLNASPEPLPQLPSLKSSSFVVSAVAKRRADLAAQQGEGEAKEHHATASLRVVNKDEHLTVKQRVDKVSQEDPLTAKQRVAAYDAERKKTEAQQNVRLRKLLKKSRRPPSPDPALVLSRRVVSYDAQRKASAVQLHAEAMRQAENSEFKVVSLGCCCAVNLTLLNMSLRQEAFPFDNIRTSIEGVCHFLESQFVDFLPFRASGGLQSRATYEGEYHSFWHDNLDALEDHAKYKRRTDRFLALASLDKKLFFVFACNSSLEVASGELLLRSLCDLFGESKVWVLLLVDGQHEDRLVEVEGTAGRLLVHCMPWRNCEDQGTLFMQGVETGVSSFIEHVQTSSTLEVIQSCAALVPRLIAYTGGDTRREKYKFRRKNGQRLARSQTRQSPKHDDAGMASVDAEACE